jgi:uncharacterized membrane protein
MSPAVQSDFMRTLKISQCACGLAVTILALGFCSYSIRELLASLALFTMAFLFLALAVLAAILLWWASEELANRTGPASRKVIAFSRRLIAIYAGP